jgi:hypothetical protein
VIRAGPGRESLLAWSTGASFIRAALSETEMGWSDGATVGEPFGGWFMDSPDKVENFPATIFNETASSRDIYVTHLMKTAHTNLQIFEPNHMLFLYDYIATSTNKSSPAFMPLRSFVLIELIE